MSMYQEHPTRFPLPAFGDMYGSGGNTSVDSSVFNYPEQNDSIHIDQVDFGVDSDQLLRFFYRPHEQPLDQWSSQYSSTGEQFSRGGVVSPQFSTEFSPLDLDLQYGHLSPSLSNQSNSRRDQSNLPHIRLITHVDPHATQQSPSDFNTSPTSSGGSLQPPSPAMAPLIDMSPVSPLFTRGPSYPRHQIKVWEWDAEYPSMGRRGPPIPQKPYRPHTISDRRRYVEEVDLEPPIMFIMQNPSECGIPLKDALTGRYMRLLGRDDAMFEQRGPSVSIRLKWPGYGNWSRQIPTKDFRSPPGPITRAKLAKNIARTIERFIKEKQANVLDLDDDRRWRVGPGCITVEDLTLVGLEHVSKGSWQAHLRLSRPF